MAFLILLTSPPHLPTLCPTPCFLPQPQAAALEQYQDYFLSLCHGFLLLPHMGSRGQGGVEKEGKARQPGILSGLVISSASARRLVL